MSEGLVSRLRDFEDNYTERKPAGTPSREIRKTIVAFANSIPEHRTGVLFLGVRDNGDIQGESNPDSLQKTIRQICEDCYPPIQYRSTVLSCEGKQVVAVEILYDENRPHFSGPAFVRQGAESVVASEQLFNEMIVSRTGKPCEILKWKGRPISVESRGNAEFVFAWDYEVMECNSQYIRLRGPNGKITSLPLDDVQLASDETRMGRLKLIVR